MAYIVEHGDSLSTIAAVTGTTPSFIKMYHNLRSSEYITNELPIGLSLVIPADAVNKMIAYKKSSMNASSGNGVNEEMDIQSTQGTSHAPTTDQKSSGETIKSEQKKEEEGQQKESSSTAHDGKLFIIQKGQAQCNQGDMMPKFVVKSHKRLYLNLAETSSESLMVMDSDTTFMPSGPSFGRCKLKPTSGGYLPCSCSPIGKWQKTYDDTTVDGNKAITEMSELLCSIGGKITVFKHGQVSQMSQKNVDNANPKAMSIYNPAVDFESFKSELNDDVDYY